MNKCLNCGKKEAKVKYCNLSCQRKHQNTKLAIKRYGNFKDFKVNCHSCNKEFTVNEREKLHPKKEKYYCTRSCANRRNHSKKTKDKIAKALTKKPSERKNPKDRKRECKCVNCGVEFCHRGKKARKTCSKSCHGRVAGLKSVQSQNRRSKNEIYFAKLCKKHFSNVLTNEAIFNGWDADVILENEKVAILWNGKWHYEKLSKNHSLKQVQNRDKIKLKEIKKMGYKPYIIKDMGKHNKDFVKEEFEKFLKIYKV